MGNRGGSELVGVGRFDVVHNDRAAALGPHATFARRRQTTADDPPSPPPRTRRDGVGARRRRFGTAALGVALVLSVARVTTWSGPGGRFEVAPVATGRSAPSVRCASVYPSLVPRPNERLLSADLRGDGCEVPVAWDGRVVRFRLDPSAERPIVLAFHDDDGVPLRGHLVLGDWDCDGTDAPSLYLPDSGQIVTFQRMDDSGRAVRRVARHTGVRSGDVQVSTSRDGCDAVEVVPVA